MIKAVTAIAAAFFALAGAQASAALLKIGEETFSAPPGYAAQAETFKDSYFGTDAVLGGPLESENSFDAGDYSLDAGLDTLTWDLPDGQVLLGFLVKASHDVIIFAFTSDMLMNAGVVDFDITPYSSAALSNLRPVFGEVSEVPLPAAAWLMIAGLGGLGAASRKRKAA